MYGKSGALGNWCSNIKYEFKNPNQESYNRKPNFLKFEFKYYL